MMLSAEAMPPCPAQILAARESAGLTQEQAAELVHAGGRRTWQDWERGVARMHPGLWELFRIKTAGVTSGAI